MAYASEYLEALREKKLEGLFINDYFLADKVLNSMEFSSGATANATGGLSYTVVRNEEVVGAATSRAFGQDYQVVNANPVPETFYLTVLGGKYSVDTTLEDIVKMVNTENESRAKMAAAQKEFARQLIKGTGTNNQFIGIDKYCEDNELVSEIILDISGGITQSVAESFYAGFNEVCGELNVDPNRIFVSRALGSKLSSIQGILQKYVQKPTIGKLNYETFADLPIVPFDNNIGFRFTATSANVGLEVGAVYENMYIVRVDVNDGIFCASPIQEQNFVKVIKPIENGSPIATGYVDFPTCLVVKNRGAVRKVMVKIKSAPVVAGD